MSANPTSAQRSYWCFISYRHADNKEPGRQWATWLHQAIETYEVPRDLIGTVNERGDTILERIFPVFRDEEELPVDADLASPIYRALEGSKILIVICSPRSVASQYVNNEIYYFKQLEKKDLILALMIEGEPNARWDETKAALGFVDEQECFPHALKHSVDQEGNWQPDTTEPIAADFRLGTGQGWTSLEAYRLELRKDGLNPKTIDSQIEDYRRQSELMKLKVIAGILGVPLGTLTKRDKAHQLALAQKRAKALRRWLVAVGLLAVLAVAGGGVAYQQKMEADRQKQLAERNAELANEQKKLAQANAERAEAERKKAVETLSRSDYSQGLALLGEGKSSAAMAYLSRALRGDPQNYAALARLYTLLVSQHSWPLLSGEPVSQGNDPNSVTSVCFSPDGSHFVTVHSNVRGSHALILDTQTRQIVGVPMKHASEKEPPGALSYIPIARVLEEIHSVSFSPDGTKILTVSGDDYSGAARLWDARTGEPVGQTAAPTGGPMDIINREVFMHNEVPPLRNVVVAAAYGSDGTLRFVTRETIPTPGQDAAVSRNVRFCMWDGTTGQSLGQPIVDNENKLMTLSPDGTRAVLLSGTEYHMSTAQIWDWQTGQPIGAPMEHAATITSVTFSPDGTSVVTTSQDKTARIWDASTGQPIGALMLHDDTVNSAAFSPDGNTIVTASRDRTARLWNAHTGQPWGEPLSHAAGVDCAAFSPDGHFVLTGSSDKTAQFWDVRSAQIPSLIIRHSDKVDSAVFSPDGARLLTACKDGAARLWDTVTGQAIGEPMRHEASVEMAQFSPDGSRVVTASGDGSARYWDAHTGEPLGPPIQIDRSVGLAQFSPDGTRMLTLSNGEVKWDMRIREYMADQAARLWDGHTGQPIGEPMKAGSFTRFATFSPDGNLIITDGRLKFWDGHTGTLVKDAGPKSRGYHPSFSPDSTRLIAVSEGGVQIWDCSGSSVQQETGPLENGPELGAATFSPDGSEYVTNSTDFSRIWDARTFRQIGDPIGNEYSDKFAVFNPDGNLIVAPCDSKSVQLWDGHTGQKDSEPLQQGRAIDLAGFSPDGTRILTVSDGNTVRLWDILPPVKVAPPDWIADLAEAIGGYSLSEADALTRVDARKIDELKAQLAHAPGDDFWSKVGRWYFADRDTRTISPQSTITIPEYHAEEAASAPPPVPTSPTTPPAQPTGAPPPSTVSPFATPSAGQ